VAVPARSSVISLHRQAWVCRASPISRTDAEAPARSACRGLLRLFAVEGATIDRGTCRSPRDVQGW
jgi:hypothetical protein